MLNSLSLSVHITIVEGAHPLWEVVVAPPGHRWILIGNALLRFFIFFPACTDLAMNRFLSVMRQEKKKKTVLETEVLSQTTQEVWKSWKQKPKSFHWWAFICHPSSPVPSQWGADGIIRSHTEPRVSQQLPQQPDVLLALTYDSRYCALSAGCGCWSIAFHYSGY